MFDIYSKYQGLCLLWDMTFKPCFNKLFTDNLTLMILIILNLDNQSALHTLIATYALAAEFPENLGINQIILYLCNL